jgi:hypothetical protein
MSAVRGVLLIALAVGHVGPGTGPDRRAGISG